MQGSGVWGPRGLYDKWEAWFNGTLWLQRIQILFCHIDPTLLLKVIISSSTLYAIHMDTYIVEIDLISKLIIISLDYFYFHWRSTRPLKFGQGTKLEIFFWNWGWRVPIRNQDIIYFRAACVGGPEDNQHGMPSVAMREEQGSTSSFQLMHVSIIVNMLLIWMQYHYILRYVPSLSWIMRKGDPLELVYIPS